MKKIILAATALTAIGTIALASGSESREYGEEMGNRAQAGVMRLAEGSGQAEKLRLRSDGDDQKARIRVGDDSAQGDANRYRYEDGSSDDRGEHERERERDHDRASDHSGGGSGSGGHDGGEGHGEGHGGGEGHGEGHGHDD